MSNLDVAYRLARWHFPNERQAEDVVHEASVRAFREFATFATGSARVWFLRIVRRVCDERSHRSQTATIEPLKDDQPDRILAKPTAAYSQQRSIVDRKGDLQPAPSAARSPRAAGTGGAVGIRRSVAESKDAEDL